MKDLVLNPQTNKQLEAFTEQPSHAVLIAGPTGGGKRSLAAGLAQNLLGIEDLEKYPYISIIKPEDNKAIGIEAVRQLEKFLNLKVPSKSELNRVVIIEDAHLLTHEAQNALLKTLEEPPSGSVLILTAPSQHDLLPTISSRTQIINLTKPKPEQLKAHFNQQHSTTEVDKAYTISGGLPGLMHSLLTDEAHPLSQATDMARELLSKTTYERLTMVDSLAKDKELALNTAFILQQMAHISLKTSQGKAAERWHRVLTASYSASEAITANAQPKLALTKLMTDL